MNKQDFHDLNPLEKQLEEINEWQKNANNPGYYVGSGKVPIPMKNMLKSPIVMLILCFIIFVPIVYNLVNDFSIITISNNLIGILISCTLILGGVIRLLRRNS